MVEIDVQTILILLLVAFILGVLIGASLSRPNYVR